MLSFSAALCFSLTQSPPLQTSWLARESQTSPASVSQAHAAMLAFNTGAENSNSSRQACPGSSPSHWAISLPYQLCLYNGSFLPPCYGSKLKKGVTQATQAQKRADSEMQFNVLPSCHYLELILIQKVRKITTTQHSWSRHGTFCFLHLYERMQ